MWIVNSEYSIGYMRVSRKKHQTRFCACFAPLPFCVMGIAFSAIVFTLVVCCKLPALKTYPLVTHHGPNETRDDGRVYVGLLPGTSIHSSIHVPRELSAAIRESIAAACRCMTGPAIQ